jgi:hypothetical protein
MMPALPSHDPRFDQLGVALDRVEAFGVQAEDIAQHLLTDLADEIRTINDLRLAMGPEAEGVAQKLLGDLTDLIDVVTERCLTARKAETLLRALRDDLRPA